MTAEISLLFVLATAVLALPVIRQLRTVGRQIETLRHDLTHAPQMREVRYTVREVIVTPKTAAVVAFPARTPPTIGTPGHWRKAA